MTTALLFIGIALAVFLLFIVFSSPKMHIFREIVIQATAEKIFPHINNSKKMYDWMPWAEIDPAVKISHSGPEEGVGSKSSWESTGKMGVGTAIVVESMSPKSVSTQLEYTKPMVMKQLALVLLSPSQGGTTVRWSVSGNNNFVGRLFCVFMNMDKVVGGDFEKGLAKLKSIVERG